jgi:tetratricopeptide (TPR) repeat protein
LGKCYIEINDYLAALLVFQQANVLSPNNHQILYYTGLSYSGLGEESDAALIFRKALKINPEDPEIYFALGKSYYKLNKNKKVRETLDILNMLDRNLWYQLRNEIGAR